MGALVERWSLILFLSLFLFDEFMIPLENWNMYTVAPIWKKGLLRLIGERAHTLMYNWFGISAAIK